MRRLPVRALTWAALAIALAAAGRPLHAAGPAQPLEPQQAFRLSASALGRDAVQIEFEIAKGYYLYRDRFRFEDENGAPLTGAKLPRGAMKQDPHFGRTEIYRDRVRIRVPLSTGAARPRVKLRVISQGCADEDLCYVPQKQWVEVAYPQAGAGSAPPSVLPQER